MDLARRATYESASCCTYERLGQKANVKFAETSGVGQVRYARLDSSPEDQRQATGRTSAPRS
jgi:hypothetical protein